MGVANTNVLPRSAHCIQGDACGLLAWPLDKYGVSFVSVTQQFNPTHSLGRLTLNILLSFAQFEREIIGGHICDKIAGRIPWISRLVALAIRYQAMLLWSIQRRIWQLILQRDRSESNSQSSDQPNSYCK